METSTVETESVVVPQNTATTKPKRKWGDRRDGVWLKDLDPLHIFAPHLMPNRCDCEAIVTEEIDVTNILNFLESKNADHPNFKYTLFHVIATALIKTVTLRPKMNRFIQGRRTYQRNDLSLAFVAKKYFGDEAHESLLMMKFPEDVDINGVHDRIKKEVTAVRSGKREDNSTEKMDILNKLPTWLLKCVMGVLRMLDYHGKAPLALVKEDPDFASVYITNLGSIKLHAMYHHLNNWGTNSLFVIIGEKHKAPVFDDNGFVGMHEFIELGITLDERIADGYYYAKTFKLLKYLLQHPELLELPAKEEVNFE